MRAVLLGPRAANRKTPMSTIFLVLFVISLVVVVLSLFAGIFIMARPGEANRRRSNLMMRARIGSQLGVVIFLLLYMATK